ncbi:hypothetical protein ACE38V_18215 [Cytobacillus sp. Hz8]|uniref:hypothetical protein n=1 Tax=Cytobacillus sp. Hz8 TaxID=3347168 RepID=UPI0035DBE788
MKILSSANFKRRKKSVEKIKEIKILLFKCMDCGKEDEVPEFVVEEFHFDLEEDEKVEVVCPFCNGTMKDIPSE